MGGRPGVAKQSKKNKQNSARAGRRQTANTVKHVSNPIKVPRTRPPKVAPNSSKAASPKKVPATENKTGFIKKAAGTVVSHPKTAGAVGGAAVGAGVAYHINSNRRSAHQGIDTKSQQHWNTKGYQNSTDGYG